MVLIAMTEMFTTREILTGMITDKITDIVTDKITDIVTDMVANAIMTTGKTMGMTTGKTTGAIGRVSLVPTTESSSRRIWQKVTGRITRMRSWCWTRTWRHRAVP